MIGASAAFAMFWAALSVVSNGPTPYNVAVAAEEFRVETPEAGPGSPVEETALALSADQTELMAGDPDWRASARAADVMVRTWRPERDRRIQLVLDTGRTSAGRVGDADRVHAERMGLLHQIDRVRRSAQEGERRRHAQLDERRRRDRPGALQHQLLA